MIPQGLFTQIGMIIISIAIVFTYIEPEFSKIGAVQDDIAVYQEKRSKVVSVNSQLSTLNSRLESVSNDDRRRLLSYMPDEVDPISVTRDLFLITGESGAFYLNAQYAGKTEVKKKSRDVEEDSNLPMAHTFELSVEGTYSQLKTLLSLLEQNHYPLELHNLAIKQLEGGFLSVELTLVTYAYQNNLLTSGNKIEF